MAGQRCARGWGPFRRSARPLLAVFPLLPSISGCAWAVLADGETPTSRFVTTAGPNASMIFVARTTEGIVVVDLGWSDGEEALREGLEAIGGAPREVTHVFLTHGHRDHIAAWPAVRHARFHLGEAEIPYFHGEVPFGGWIPRWADAVVGEVYPARGELSVVPLRGDTVLVVGTDSIRAFAVPGHTPGSTAYLVRGTLFVGDAVSWTPFGGFRPAQWGFSDDTRRAAESLRELFERVRRLPVRQVCTAHARCAPFDDAFVEDVLGSADLGREGQGQGRGTTGNRERREGSSSPAK